MRLKNIGKLLWLYTFLFPMVSNAQPAPVIHVNDGHVTGKWIPMTNYFGYDEPNFTYTTNGRKLIGELAQPSQSAMNFSGKPGSSAR